MRWNFAWAMAAVALLLAAAAHAQPPEAAVPELSPEIVTPPDTAAAGEFPSGETFDFPPDSMLGDAGAGDGPELPISSRFQAPLVDGYLAPSSTTGSIVNIPNILLPGTVNTVTSDTLRDQQVLNFSDTFRDIPGAVHVGNGLFPDQLFLRGLEVRSRDYRKNGFLDPSYTPRDFQNIERVEILKGPASVLYGSAAPSGTVNFITKKPLDAAFAVGGVQLGSWGLNRYVMDVNTSIDQEGEFLFRFNGAYEDVGSFRDFGFMERHLLAPSLTWVLSESTTLTWETEIVRNRRRGDLGIPALGGDVFALPNNRYVGEPSNDFIHTEDYRTSLVLNSELSDVWSLQIGASTVHYEFPGSQTAAADPIDLGGGFFLPVRSRSDFEDQEHASSLIANLTGTGYIGDFEHTMLFGTEHVYFDSQAQFNTSYVPAIDFNNPQYVNPPAIIGPFPSAFPVFRQYRQGYYLQDLVKLNDYVAVMGGVRFDDVDLTFDRDFGFGPTRSKQRFTRTTPRAGIVFSPVPDELSLFFNYSRSFNPPGGGGFPLFGGPVLPELGDMYEAGIKAQLFDDLWGGVTGFYINRDNVPFQEFSFPYPYTQTSAERSQGVELELVGRLSDRWSMIGNYAYVDTQLTDPTNPAFAGQRQRNVPLNVANIWSRYDLLQTEQSTFGVALGMVALDRRSGNLDASLTLPSFVRWDSGLYWQWSRWRLDGYLENLFNRNYIASSINANQVFPGAPFNGRVMMSFTY